MTLSEFGELTLSEFEALEHRREMDIRHERFNAGLVAAILINSRPKATKKAVTPFDFIPGFERNPLEVWREEQRDEAKQLVAEVFCRMPEATRDEVLRKRDELVEHFRKRGLEDPEGLIREVFPNL